MGICLSIISSHDANKSLSDTNDFTTPIRDVSSREQIVLGAKHNAPIEHSSKKLPYCHYVYKRDKYVIKNNNYVTNEKEIDLCHQYLDGGMSHLIVKKINGKYIISKYVSDNKRADREFKIGKMIRELNKQFFINCAIVKAENDDTVINMEFVKPIAYVREVFSTNIFGIDAYTTFILSDLYSFFQFKKLELFDKESLLDVFRQILAIFIIIHNKYPGFRHNDLHLGNILLTHWKTNTSKTVYIPEVGEYTFQGKYLVKLCDFGISGFIDSDNDYLSFDSDYRYNPDYLKSQISDIFFLSLHIMCDLGRYELPTEIKNKWYPLAEFLDRIFGDLIPEISEEYYLECECNNEDKYIIKWMIAAADVFESYWKNDITDKFAKKHEKTRVIDIWKLLQ